MSEINPSEFKSRMEEIPASRLAIDRRVQRELIPARVRKLVKSFDLDAIGVVTVSERAKGERFVYVVIDGQHRVIALREHGLNDWPLKCHVYTGLSLQDEAWIFRKLNDHRLLSKWEDFDKGLREGDAECKGIERIVDDAGLGLYKVSQDQKVACIATLQKIYRNSMFGRNGADVLREALDISVESWGGISSGLEGSVLEGLSLVAGKYNGEVDRKALVQKLSKYPGGPSALLGNARGLRNIKSLPVPRLVASLVVSLYNKGRRSGQVAEL